METVHNFGFNNNYMETGEIIRSERERRGLSQDGLAKLVGVSQVAIKKIESGETRHSKFMPKIARVLELDLATLDPSLNEGPSPEIIPAKQLTGERDFPIHAAAEGGPGEIIVDSAPVDFQARPVPLLHVRESYGLLITGTSMEPEYRAGDTALINPHLPFVGGEVYIFYAEREGEARATIKMLRRATEERWLVTQHNPPEGAPKDFVLARREWRWAHRVIGKYARH